MNHFGELSAEKLRHSIDPSHFTFKSTEELPALDEILGQERAVNALNFGIEIHKSGYHMYALGPVGTGRTAVVKRLLERKAEDSPVPEDWCYVNNFEDRDRPRALRLPPGKGVEFRADMDEFVEELETELPRIFESDEYQKEQEKIQERLSKDRQEALEDLKKKAEESKFTLIQTAQGLALAPVVDGDVMSPDKLQELDEQQRRDLERKRGEMEKEFRELRRSMGRLQKRAREKMKELDRNVVGSAVEHLIEDLQEKYSEYDQVVEFLGRAQTDLLENIPAFKQLEKARQGEQQKLPLPIPQAAQKRPSFDHYRVNLFVNNSDLEKAPVVHELNPTYQNLIGRIEHEARYGALVTDFRMLKPGSLHRANGGYLVVDALDLLMKPFSWDALKRALRKEEVRIEGMAEEYRLISTRSLEPEPIPIDLKVVMIGDPMVYYLLSQYDKDFREFFKVKVDFGTHTEWSEETIEKYAQFVGNVCREEGLKHFDPSGVSRIVEAGLRIVHDQEKLSTKFGDIVDLIREADFWAHKNGNGLVTDKDVTRAVEERIHRSDRIEELVREMFRDKMLLIDTDGEVVGQVNGLSVVPLGDYSFGRPARITARTHVGREGLVNIDREVELGGRIHNKGTMILSGYLGGKFAQNAPFALSASITFEQMYEEVDGDSASSAELYALISSLSEVPIRQGIAVTGSVNQRGQVQAIGGVNEKIEGFFEICRVQGLTGEQGVLIPQSNVRNLMLKEEVVEAVSEGKFHIFAVSTIDEGLEILTGRQAGEAMQDGTFPEDTVNELTRMKLQSLAESARQFSAAAKGPAELANA